MNGCAQFSLTQESEIEMKILINSGRAIPVFKKRKKLLHEMQKNGADIYLCGFEENADSVCQEESIHFIKVPISRAGLNPFADFAVCCKYYKAIKKSHVDIVHSYTAKPNIYTSLAARVAGVKYIYPTVNGLGYAFTENQGTKNKLVQIIMCALYKISFAGATRVFFQNSDDAEELICRKIIKKEQCVIVAGSGIDLTEFPFSECGSSPVFFLASRLLITKGLRTYFEAAEIVKKKYPEARFLLAGDFDPNPDGIREAELEQYAKEGNIEYLGLVKDMKNALKSCTVFVLPSYYREGIPHAILEAMSTGRAIITTNAPGCKETVNGKNGFLIEPRNSEQLAEKMIWMVEHPEEVKQMGVESRKYAEEKFDVEKVNRVMLETMEI